MSSSDLVDITSQIKDPFYLSNIVLSEKYDNLLAFINGTPSPYIFDFNKKVVSLFTNKNKFPSPITSIAISPNRELLVTGHGDGSVSFFNVSSKAFLKSHQKLHSKPISAISFDDSNDNIYAGDETGLITVITLKVLLSMYSFAEKNFQKFESKINNIKYLNSQFLVSISAGYFLVESKSLTVSKLYPFPNLQTVIFSLDNSTISLVSIGKIRFVTFASNRTLGEFDSPIINGAFISNSLFSFYSPNFDIFLISIKGEKISQLTLGLQLSGLSVFNENLILFTEAKVFSYKYESWIETINKIVLSKDFNQAFQLLINVNFNFPNNLVGLPLNLAVRRSQVHKLGEEILLKAIESNQGDLAEIFVYANTLELADVLETQVLQVFQKENRTAQFFEALFRKFSESNFF